MSCIWFLFKSESLTEFRLDGDIFAGWNFQWKLLNLFFFLYIYIFWTFSNSELFVLVLTQRSKCDGGSTSGGKRSTAIEERDPLLQDDMDWHHTHIHMLKHTAGVVDSLIANITFKRCSDQCNVKHCHVRVCKEYVKLSANDTLWAEVCVAKNWTWLITELE